MIVPTTPTCTFKNSDRHLRYQRRMASTIKTTGVTPDARTPLIQTSDGHSSSKKNTHGRRKKRKRASADIITATATATAIATTAVAAATTATTNTTAAATTTATTATATAT
eukprot:CAMPEP_0170783434 /NCGR_PEP_ID=MMETSP0733-20121128/15528_1 /TAXON_ID=186038 /ORGANISM="Fragilariopsis kerguelensis, Strain L26-C5" /LENGTH=110 /DNA_ID=CAMNT_0011128135 /DNA_START=157 /DNA_END=486 /DNA_ORIENTATION=+